MVEILKVPVAGPTVWQRQQAEDSSRWTYVLDGGMRAELLRAAEKVHEQQVSVWDLDRHAMPLAQTRRLVTECLHQLQHGFGLALLKGVPTEGLTPAEAQIVLGVLGLQLGTMVVQNGRGDRIVSIRDYGKGKLTDKTIRGYQTNEALRWHSDAPDIAAILCLTQAKHGGVLSVASAMHIYNTLLQEAPELLGVYYAGIFYDYRGEEPPGSPPAFRNAIFGYYNGQLTCRYYLRSFVAPGMAKLGFAESEIETLALDTFEAIASRPENHISMRLEPGDLQLVDDNITVHRRTAFSDAPDGNTDSARHLLRLWINPDDARQFPEFVSTHRWGMPLAAHPQT